ncbi:MAG: hypothetical protein ACOZBW_04325 [Thermodesulfobacteriota bacterium]
MDTATLFNLFSFSRISASNGWSIAALGITITITCLAVLSMIISRVPLLVGFFDRIGGLFSKEDLPVVEMPLPPTAPEHDFSTDGTRQIAAVYRKCADSLGGSFLLTDLYRISQEKGLPHPHLTIKTLREEGLLLAEGDGRFKWNL